MTSHDAQAALKETAEEIAADADTGHGLEAVYDKLHSLVNEYHVPEREAERSVRRSYDAVIHTPPPEPASDLLDKIKDGHVTGVRTAPEHYRGQGRSGFVVAGTIELAEDLSEGWVATFQDATAWRWDAGEPETVRAHLDLIHDDGPPELVRRGEKDTYNVEPGLHISGHGGLEVLELDPVWSTGGRVEHYAGYPIGSVEAVCSGHVTDPCVLLPDAAEVGE